MSKWISLQEAVNEGKIPKNPGAYKIRCVIRSRPNRPRAINRIWGTDKKGILYFGETGAKEGLRGRLREFRSAADKGNAAHSGGKRYHSFEYNGRRGYGLDSLQVKWVEFKSKEDAKKRQNKWLQEYASRFGELPPLNGQGAQ